MATPVIPLRWEHDVVNPNIVKAVGTQEGKALYFSRYPIPYCKSNPLDLTAGPHSPRACAGYFKHIGIYLYRRDFLLKYIRLAPTPLEIAESLEQLRILENGYPIDLVTVAEDSVSVDTPEDLATVEVLIRKSEKNSTV
jgi:3-deoxy-manno-octulosonate cytidylyltransferase (CMP-KDO synthetase)